MELLVGPNGGGPVRAVCAGRDDTGPPYHLLHGVAARTAECTPFILGDEFSDSTARQAVETRMERCSNRAGSG